MKPNWVGNWTGKHHLEVLDTSSVSLTVIWFSRINSERVCVPVHVGERPKATLCWCITVGLKCRFVPDIEFFSHCGGVWWGDYQPEKSWRVGEEMISLAAGAVMITLCHLKQMTNSMVLPACPFTHYTWPDRLTVNNYLVHFSKTLIHIQPLLSWRAAHFAPGCDKVWKAHN